MQNVMSNNYKYNERVKKSDGASGENTPIHRSPQLQAQQPPKWEASYQDVEKKILGCKHYRRECKLIPKCCGDEQFTCRFCHDEFFVGSETNEHIMDRHATERVQCMKCGVNQGNKGN